MMKPLCLNCHGEPGKQINEATFNAIKAKYPKDKAMGYKEGDFRGLWVVKVR
jgi:cytochrome c